MFRQVKGHRQTILAVIAFALSAAALTLAVVFYAITREDLNDSIKTNSGLACDLGRLVSVAPVAQTGRLEGETGPQYRERSKVVASYNAGLAEIDCERTGFTGQ